MKSPIFSFRIYFKSHTPGRLPQSSPPCWYLSTKHTLLTSRKRINLWCLNSGMQPRKDRALFWLLAIHGKICTPFLVLIPLSPPGIPSSLLPRLVVSPWIALRGEFPSEAQDDWVLVQGRQQAPLPHTHDFNSPYQQAGRQEEQWQPKIPLDHLPVWQQQVLTERALGALGMGTDTSDSGQVSCLGIEGRLKKEI